MNILILTSNTGGGHIKATEAIKEHINLKNLNHNVKIINTLDYVNPSFNKLVTSFYSECIKKYPDLFGKIYYYSESEHVPVNIFSLILKNLSKKLLPVISRFNTDIIISTHPFSTEMISYLKETRKIINVKLVNLLTDYAPHKFWIHNHVDAYITATDQMTEDMIKRGVHPSLIHPIGIPVGENFMKVYNKLELLKSIGFDENSFTILLMSGSVGVDYVIKIFKILINLNRNIQIIIITGNNKILYNKFEYLISKYKNTCVKFYLLGFVKNVSQYMQISDVVVTKPGGLTTTEAIFSSLPIIFFDAIPGQEEQNANFILRNNIGMRISKSQKDITSLINIIDNKEELLKMKENIKSFKKNDFIENLMDIIHSFFKDQPNKQNYTY